MRFWIGLILSLLGGLVGIGLFREWIKSNLSYIGDSKLDTVSLIILLIGLVISAIDHLNQSKDLKLLKNEQKGRVLEPKQKENLLENLKKISKTKIVLMSIQGNRESFRFANVIKDILVKSNWEVDGIWEEIILGGVGSGVIVREKSSELNSIGKAVNKIMNDNGVDTRIVIKPDLDPNLIEIIVGPRP